MLELQIPTDDGNSRFVVIDPTEINFMSVGTYGETIHITMEDGTGYGAIQVSRVDE